MKQSLNEQFRRMQKIAGIITENENETITLDPNKLKAFTMAVNAFGGSRGDKIDFLKIAKLLSSNQLAAASNAIKRVDTSPRELMYDIMMDTYPELWDMLFDNEEGDYIALATPKAGLPENVNEVITLDPNKLKVFANAINKFGGSKGDKNDFLKIVELLSNNELAKAAKAIQRVDTSPKERMYDIMMETYPELWDMLFDNEEGDYIALATPKASLPENEINIGQKNVIKSYLEKFRKFAQDNTADDADLKNLKTAVSRFYKELGL